jgi:hypothetical protein
MQFFGKPNSGLVKTYKKRRKTGTNLINKIMESPCFSQQLLTGAARLLGVLQGKTLTMENEEESSALMDFLFHDYQVQGKTVVEIYREQVGAANPLEEEIMDAWRASCTSLFKVTDVVKSEDTLILSDFFGEQKDIELVDISLSQTSVPGLLLFLRKVPIDSAYMTSGSTFVFAEDKEKHLLRRYKPLMQKVKSQDEAIQRFVAFFKLNRTDGIEVRYR